MGEPRRCYFVHIIGSNTPFLRSASRAIRVEAYAMRVAELCSACPGHPPRRSPDTVRSPADQRQVEFESLASELGERHLELATRLRIRRCRLEPLTVVPERMSRDPDAP